MTIWRLLRAVLPCSHAHRYKDRRSGRLVLICDDCGDANTPDIGDKAKLRKLQKQWAASKRWRADKPKADVYVLPKITRNEGA